jgi:ABC-2 type transport system permease protein
MTFNWSRAMTIARREYLFTVRRKAFIVTVVGLPLFYAALMFVMIKPQVDNALKAMKDFHALGIVDSTGLFAEAPKEILTEVSPDENPFQRARGPATPSIPAVKQTYVTQIEFFPDQAAALDALKAEKVKQVIVVPGDYLATGRLRRYAKSENIFNDDAQRPVSRWLARGLLAGRVDSTVLERAVRPSQGMDLYTENEAGEFRAKNNAGQMLDFLLPFACGLLLSISIVIGGQYMLQGVSEEKESRILESMMATVSPEDLIVGKLIGLGGAGLTMVGSWLAMGAALSGPALLAVQLPVTPVMVVFMVLYFLLGYLFYGSIMTGVGAVTNNLREAAQYSFAFTFMNFIPFYMMTTIIGHPDSGLAVGLSLFPPTAPVSMMLRLTSGAHVPAWQLALSVALILGLALITIRITSKIFRVGMLMYGKTPTLPEIVRWVRQG